MLPVKPLLHAAFLLCHSIATPLEDHLLEGVGDPGEAAVHVHPIRTAGERPVVVCGVAL